MVGTALGTVWLRPLAAVVRFADAKGRSMDPIFESVGLSAAMLRDPDARIPLPWVERLFCCLEREFDEPNIGLTCAAYSSKEELDLYHYFGVSCPDVGTAMQAFADSVKLLCSSATGSLRRSNRQASLSVDVGPGADVTLGRHSTEYLLGCTLLGFGRLTEHDLRPVQVNFRHPRPPDVGSHLEAFGFEPIFSSDEDALVFEEGVLKLPTLAPDQELEGLLRRQAQMLMSQIPSLTSFSSELRKLLVDALPTGQVSLQWAAQEIGVSTRTLQRRLHADGEPPFREFLDGIRRARSSELLNDSTLSIAAVAKRLGYGDSRTFARVFRRWFGTSPTESRLPGANWLRH